MKKTTLIGIVVAALAVIATAVLAIMPGSRHEADSSHHASLDSADQNGSKASEPNTVAIRNYEFGPRKINVKKGTKITWINHDKDRHNIKPDQDYPEFKTSPLLSKDGEYSVIFEAAGTYNYHCSPHPYMKASVEVTE